MMNSLPWSYLPSASDRPRRARRLAAALLRGASDQLARLAVRLSAHEAADEVPAEPEAWMPVLEFHAEAGAPEGALYVNGRLVGFLQGVQRL